MANLITLFLNIALLLRAAVTLADGNTSAPINATNTTLPTGPKTTDDACGPDHNGTVCILDGILPCCSFCGGDKRYCGDGCQAGFGLCTVPNKTLGRPACSWARQGDSPRCDGQCGADFAGARCDASAGADEYAVLGVFNYGPCCSKAGFCGNTSAHCEAEQGCQTGCWGGAEAAASSSGSVSTVTVTASASAAATSSGVAVARGVPEGVLVLLLGVSGVVLGV
ncbi:glyoxal oxidase [Neofusicoccum parvum]|uniref:Glyoxal oxidase n=1 Tax=Neofusicoccum parvum TaxID=310453 RepID=A0ACB5S0H7_9PEZI|nr:glyoxal oxidase [Neofusicoccum parvum]